MLEIGRGVVYLPFRAIYFALYLTLTVLFTAWLLLLFGLVALRFFGLPSWLIVVIIYLSLIGSAVNLPLFSIESVRLVVKPMVVRVFFVEWVIPEVSWEERKTRVMINLGGALIPTALSIYLIAKLIEEAGIIAVFKLIVSLIIATTIVHLVAKPVPGLGIVTPGLVPPLATLLAVAITGPGTSQEFFAMLYAVGTLSTLIGADLMNLDKIPDLGAPVVSIGGAGTFDGVFLTGIMAIWLALLL